MKKTIMKYGLIVLMLAATSISGFAQCAFSTGIFEITLSPAFSEAGQSITILPVASTLLPAVASSRLSVIVGGIETNVLSSSAHFIVAQIPSTLSSGEHTLYVCIKDGPSAEALLEIGDYKDSLDLDIKEDDPDPSTQYGGRTDLSTASRRPHDFARSSYPNGGYGGNLLCLERHRVDGVFSKINASTDEWAGIAPLQGRFSHLYLDYCPENSVMYLMNDWLIGKGAYAKSCYNLFEFTTGNGRENWKIKVTHDSISPVIVELNGTDVTTDTLIVMGGAFGFGASGSDTTPHTMYEFAVKVSEGLFMIPEGSDPVQFKPATSAKLVCDENGVEGYGLIGEPTIRTAVFSASGVTTQQHERYIPQGGVLGLETEPNVVSGEIRSGTISYRSGNSQMLEYACSGISEIDGTFSQNEWTMTEPAVGKYSYLYAQYCNGYLHILNDWVHGTELPHLSSCYNLFELFTGNGTQHWGIWVWQDATRKPTVILNGVDVSADTTIIRKAAPGFGASPSLATPHTQYEFLLATAQGGFALMFADPGPSSICSANVSSVGDITISLPISLRPNPVAGRDEEVFLHGGIEGDQLSVFDVQGRLLVQQTILHNGDSVVRLTTLIRGGVYTLQVVRGADVFKLPLWVVR